MKSSKATFDESKLPPPQRAALAIARQQGAKFGRTLEDLTLAVEPEARDELAEAVLEHRLQDRNRASKTPTE